MKVCVGGVWYNKFQSMCHSNINKSGITLTGDLVIGKTYNIFYYVSPPQTVPDMIYYYTTENTPNRSRYLYDSLDNYKFNDFFYTEPQMRDIKIEQILIEVLFPV